MIDLIDRAALVEVLEKRAVELADEGLHIMAGSVSGCVIFALQAPVVEAAPVVHARWDNLRDISGLYQCSECGIIDHRKPRHKFCPNCGARMDAGPEVGT